MSDFDPDEDLDNEVRVFTQWEAWLLAFAVANFVDPNHDYAEVRAFIEEAVPKVLA